MNKVADLSFARLGGAALKAHGFEGVMRYFSPCINKNLSAAELRDYHNNGLAVGAVWESYEDRALGGQKAGLQDATEALRQADSLGFTGAIYFAVDFDAQESQQPAIHAYFQGVANAIDKGRIGAYGGYSVVKRLFDDNMITFGWQTVAWSGGQIDPRIHLFQEGTQDFGNKVDNNQVKQANYGQMFPGRS